MRIGPIILRIRTANTTFKNNVGGAAELEIARNSHGVKSDMAFVIPIEEPVTTNKVDTGIDQTITEKFAVVVILPNDKSQADKFGFFAYDQLHDVRSELFRALLGWEINEAMSQITYAGGQLLPLNPVYLWYQFIFQYDVRIIDHDGYSDIEETDGEFKSRLQESQIPDLLKIYSNYITWPNENLPYTGDLPIADGYPDVSLPNMAQLVDVSDDKNPGAFDRGFASGYDFYRILNRRNDLK